MREMIFNDACLSGPLADLRDVSPMLAEIAKGMAILVSRRITTASLRMRRHLYEFACSADGTLWDAFLVLQKDRRFVEESRFLMQLAQKAPLLEDMPSEVVGRFHMCQPVPVLGSSDALMLCAHTDGIAVSLPLNGSWLIDQLTIEFDEIDEIGEIVRVEEVVDHMSVASHAILIEARYENRLRRTITLGRFWDEKAEAFPNLTFGPGVELNLKSLNAGFFDQIVGRLSELDDAAREWAQHGGSAPRWRSKISPESDSRLNDPVLRQKMMFRTVSGGSALFQWHARYGGAGRIHLRFGPSIGFIEIGYIGRKIV